MLSRLASRALELLAVVGVVLGGRCSSPGPPRRCRPRGRELRPGQKIEVGAGKFCMLGPFAYSGETSVFLTARHCITQTGTVITA